MDFSRTKGREQVSIAAGTVEGDTMQRPQIPALGGWESKQGVHEITTKSGPELQEQMSYTLDDGGSHSHG